MLRFRYVIISIAIVAAILSSPLLFSDNPVQQPSARLTVDVQDNIIREHEKVYSHQPKEFLHQSIKQISDLSLARQVEKNAATIRACQQLRIHVGELTQIISSLTADKLLRRCRRYMNLQHAGQSQWNDYIKARQLIKKQGWQAVLKGLQQGEIGNDANLLADQSMGLYYLFAANGVSDPQAYKQLSNYGVKFNTKALEIAIARTPNIVTTLLQLNPTALAHDMGYSPVTLAASYQRPQLALQLVAQGYQATDSLGRDLLAAAMSSSNSLVAPETWVTMIENGDIAVNESHRQLLQQAEQKGWPEPLINAIAERLPDN